MGKDDHHILPISDSQLKEKRRERRGKGDEKEKKREVFQTSPQGALAGLQGTKMLGAEGQKGAPHPHSLLPDCPDTEGAHAQNVPLDNHPLSWRKVALRGGRRRQREVGGQREDRENNTTQNPENCLLLRSPAQGKRVTREWGDWKQGGESGGLWIPDLRRRWKKGMQGMGTREGRKAGRRRSMGDREQKGEKP